MCKKNQLLKIYQRMLFQGRKASRPAFSFVVSHNEIWPTLPYCGPPSDLFPCHCLFWKETEIFDLFNVLKIQKKGPKNVIFWSFFCCKRSWNYSPTFSWKAWLYGKIVYIYRSQYTEVTCKWFLWNINWDLGWFWAVWQYWKIKIRPLMSNFRERCFSYFHGPNNFLFFLDKL